MASSKTLPILSMIAIPSTPTLLTRSLKTANIKPLKLPPKSPNLNAFAERFVRSIKHECLNNLILFGEKSLRYVVKEYIDHYHYERNHQGLDNVIPFPDDHLNRQKTAPLPNPNVSSGMLNYYHRKAA